MKDESKTQKQLLEELAVMQRRILSLERSNKKHEKDEDELKQSEKQFRLIFENSPEGIYQTTPDGRFISMNPAFARICGYDSPEEMIHSVTYIKKQLYVNPKDMEQVKKVLAEKGILKGFEAPFYRKDGKIIWVSIYVQTVKDEDGNIFYQGTIGDITEYKNSAADIEMKSLLLDSATDSIFVMDLDGKFYYVNESAYKSRGYNRDELMAMNLKELDDPAYREAIPLRFNEILEKGTAIFESTHLRKDGSLMPVEIHSRLMEMKGQKFFFSVIRDITDRKKAEETLRESAKKYSELAHSLPQIIFETDMKGNLTFVNHAAYAMMGYSAEEFERGLNVLQMIAPEDWDRARLNIQKMLSGEELPGNEYTFLKKNGSAFPVITHTVPIVRDNQVLGLRGFVIDITDLKMSTERLRKALDATVQAIAFIVETRDPYTTGHQRRVADLAQAIAKEMNLTNDQIDGIRTAAIIHDIGKISVPAEILSKPTKLTNLEFSLIKVHAQAGYDILKDIEFPWPIARMVLEHHERMNGSGYPNGLKGDQSLLESRILSVADVVEAMASHRPYRPGLGIEASLEEIEKNRGTFYDINVVDACLRLFRDKNYQLESYVSSNPV